MQMHLNLKGVVTALGIKREKALGYTQQVSGEEVSDVKLQLRKLTSGKVAGLDIKSSGNFWYLPSSY
jgi:hypothetical protein